LKSLITGMNGDSLWPRLRRVLATATEVDIAVSFIKTSGITLIYNDLKAALLSDRQVTLRILTSDYLGVTDPAALNDLLTLVKYGADVRVYQSRSQSFHLKTYIFVRSQAGQMQSADAFVGSSNISKTALMDGLEWNYHIDYPNDLDQSAQQRIEEIHAAFDKFFALPEVVVLSKEWINEYVRRRGPQINVVNLRPADDDPIIPEREPDEVAPTPREHQQTALNALLDTRQRGFGKGLVVLATGLGKTYLAAFDATAMQAKRVLFVAHREEILGQAERSFVKIMPTKTVGYYTGQQKDVHCDLLFASVQTLGRPEHFQRFATNFFDYIVIDEFHHAAAKQYQKLLDYFKPQFLLGLTATPERADNRDILTLCDHNLVYRMDLFDGIRQQYLSKFQYLGILDKDTDYEHIPWRNGRFDPVRLSNAMATLKRAGHVYQEWKQYAQTKTLAFCVSKKHADFMAEQFVKQKVPALSIHTDSPVTRSEALEQLASGKVKVLFSVDLFNEGVDLPEIDTVMMLRPTESGVLFLQQMGRGLRPAEGKSHLVILDFVGNHHSFLNRPAILLGQGGHLSRAQLAKAMRDPTGLLPDGCFVNYDLEFIEFVESRESADWADAYFKLKATMGKRPTLLDMWNAGKPMTALHRFFGSWWEFLDELGELTPDELDVLETMRQWFRDLLADHKNDPVALFLMMAWLSNRPVAETSVDELQAWLLAHIETQGWQALLTDELSSQTPKAWLETGLRAWLKTNATGQCYVLQDEGRYSLVHDLGAESAQLWASMSLEELVWRVATLTRQKVLPPKVEERPQLLYFPEIQMACGHFRTGRADNERYVLAPPGVSANSLERSFIARAKGNSMNGGKNPIFDGDYLLFEFITPESAGKISDQIVAIERQDSSGDDQYLLRRVLKKPQGGYTLRANNPDYADMDATDEMTTFARLKGKVDPLQLFVGDRFMREDIPGLFGEEFNPGNWNVGHVSLSQRNTHVLLVTLNKQGHSENHQFTDYFVSEREFHWQSQNSTAPDKKRGQEIINHKKLGIHFYLFVREHKLENKKSAPFEFKGEIEYLSHSGANPMSVHWRLLNV
jgi:superfamily II DNA or RNA helicase/HKD family nuclease